MMLLIALKDIEVINWRVGSVERQQGYRTPG